MQWRHWLARVREDLGDRPRNRRSPKSKRSALTAIESLEDRVVLTGPADIEDLVNAFNLGRQQFQSADYAGLALLILGTDLPVLDVSLAEALGIGDVLDSGVSSAPALSTSDTFGQINQFLDNLENAGFEKEYFALTPEGGGANGDLLRLKYSTTIDVAADLFHFDLGDFEFFSDGVDGEVSGALTAAAQPITVSITFGVDIQDDDIAFFVKEGNIVETGGIDFAGSHVDTRVAIKDLIDVDVEGPITGGISGWLGLVDADPDDKLRIGQLADIGAWADGDVEVNIAFSPDITIELPFVGELPSLSLEFNASLVDGELDITVDPFAAFDNSFWENYAGQISGMVQGAYGAIMGIVDIFGGQGAGFNDKLPAIDKSLFEALGLPDLSNGLGFAGGELKFNLVEDPVGTVIKLVRGEHVDLVRFVSDPEDSGREWSKSYDIILANAVVPIGPLPLSAEIKFTAGASAAYSYKLGFGVDTTGFYIDAGTSITGSGSVFAGLEAALSAGLWGISLGSVKVAAGVGGTLGASISFVDPDRDGRIYLEEIVFDLDQPIGGIADDLISRIDVDVWGEAYGFARGVVKLLFWSKTIFDERFTIPLFRENLLGLKKTVAHDALDYREEFANGPDQRFRPLGDGELPASLLGVDGTLTLSASVLGVADLSNSVSIEEKAEGLSVVWRGVGSRVFAGVNQVHFIGGDKSDRFVVKNAINVAVHAEGLGGDDHLEASNVASTLSGGDGADTLVGGVASDAIHGGVGIDVIRGGGGGDTIHGGQGGDIISGGDGDDVIHGEGGADQIKGDAHNDTIYGGDGIDNLEGGSGNDWIDGGAGELIVDEEHPEKPPIPAGNQIFGGAGQDILIGGAHNDYIVGGAEEDQIQGREGDDLLFGDDADPSSGLGADDTILGQAGNDYIFGEGGHDRIYGDDSLTGGDAGDDLLSGDAGDDVIHGGGDDSQGIGSDTIRGGGGNDLLSGDRGPDQIYGGVGQDSLDGGRGDDLLFLDFEGAGVEIVDFASGGIDQDMLVVSGKSELIKVNPETWIYNDNIADVIEVRQISAHYFEAFRYEYVGGAITDSMKFTLDGSTNGDVERLGVFGHGGDDTIYAAPGVLKNLVIDGGAGDDSLTGGDGRDLIFGGDGDDHVDGGANDDVVRGDRDPEDDPEDVPAGTIVPTPGDDTVLGGTGSDLVYGGGGQDFVSGGEGRDAVYGEDGDDLLMAGEGILGDLLDGGAGRDTLVGGAGIDDLRGGDDPDVLFGGDLGDDLDGGGGDQATGEGDIVFGELGRDNVRGGAQNDYLGVWFDLEIRASVASSVFNTFGVTVASPSVLDEEAYLSSIVTTRVNVIRPARDLLSDIADKLDTAENFGANWAAFRAIYTASSLSSADWITLETLLSASGVLSPVEWAEFQERVRDPNIGGGASAEERIETWANYYGAIYDDMLTESLLDPDRITAGGGDDQLFGSPFYDSILGEEGNDVIFFSGTAGTTVDFLSGGNGSNDMLAFKGTNGADVIEATLVESPLGSGNLVGQVILNDDPIDGRLEQVDIETLGVYALGGDDRVTVHFGNQATYKIFIDGGAGDDRLDAASSDGLPLQAMATLVGGVGDDTIHGGVSDDVIEGGDGDDLIQARGGDDTIHGGAGDDHLYGNGQNDTLYGGTGADVLDGGAGMDFLDGDDPGVYGTDGDFDVLNGGLDSDALQYSDLDDAYFGFGGGNIDGSGTDELLYPTPLTSNRQYWVFEGQIGVFEPQGGYAAVLSFPAINYLGDGGATDRRAMGFERIVVQVPNDPTIEVYRAAGPFVSDYGYFSGDVHRRVINSNGDTLSESGSSDRPWTPHADGWNLGIQGHRGWVYRYGTVGPGSNSSQLAWDPTNQWWESEPHGVVLRPDRNIPGPSQGFLYLLVVDVTALIRVEAQADLISGTGVDLRADGVVGDTWVGSGYASVTGPGPGGLHSLSWTTDELAVNDIVVVSGFAQNPGVTNHVSLNSLSVTITSDPELPGHGTLPSTNAAPVFTGPTETTLTLVPGQTVLTTLEATDSQTPSERLFYYLITDESPLDVRLHPTTGELSIHAPRHLASGDYSIEIGVADDDMDFNKSATQTKTITVHLERATVDAVVGERIFDDDLATFNDGNLIGQNGWTGSPTQTLPVVDGVLDGQAPPIGTPPIFIGATKPLALPSDWDVATASFEVKAFNETANGFYKSNGDYFGFSTTAPQGFTYPGGVTGMAAIWTPGFDAGLSGNPVWTFDVRGLTGDADAYVNIPRTANSSGEFVDLRIHINRETLQVYGSYDLGDGVQTTASFAITPERLALVDAVAVIFDTRNRDLYRGVQIRRMGVATQDQIEVLDEPAFDDDLATFNDGNLIGQNGWTGSPTQTLPVVDGVLDGQAPPIGTPPIFIGATKPLALPSDWDVATASFEVKAFNETANGFYKSNGDYFGFSTTAPQGFTYPGGVTGMAAIWTPGFDAGLSGNPVWTFDVRGLTGDADAYVNIPRTANSSGEFVDLRIHINRETLQVYGSYDLGDGVQTTTSFAITPERLALVDAVAVIFDTRNRDIYRGVQIRRMGVATHDLVEVVEGSPTTIYANVDTLGFGAASAYEYAWFVDDVEQVGATASSFSYSPSNQGQYVVRVEVSDPVDGEVYSDVVTLLVKNDPPTPVIAGETTDVEGGWQVFTIADDGDSGLLANEIVTREWSVTRDGNPYGSPGNSQAFSFHMHDQGTYVVTLILTDDAGATGTDTHTIVVSNVAPTASIVAAAQQIFRNEPVSFTLSANDPSAFDQAAGFSFEIDWNGDGTFDETVVGPSGSVVAHTFEQIGTFDVRVRATDKDGGVGAPSTLAIDVAPWALVADAGNPALFNLVISGTTGDDFYSFWGLGGNDVGLITGDLGVFRVDGVTGKIIVHMHGGDDTITVETGMNGFDIEADMGHGFNIFVPLRGANATYTVQGGDGVDQFFLVGAGNITAHFYGGGGDDVYLDVSGDPSNVTDFHGEAGNDGVAAGLGSDTLDGGDGNDMLVGGFYGADSADTLIGGAGDDFLIGGPGADTIDGGVNQDLIVAGSLVFLPEITDGYLPIWAEWGFSGGAFSQRVANISNNSPSALRLNGNYFITPGDTALDDGAVDEILGGSDEDWLLYDFVQDSAADYSLAVDVRTNLG